MLTILGNNTRPEFTTTEVQVLKSRKFGEGKIAFGCPGDTSRVILFDGNCFTYGDAATVKLNYEFIREVEARDVNVEVPLGA